jgi:glycosyltransferase involved in cell wall biosynthesis
MKVLNVNVSIDPVYGGGTGERTFQMSRYLARAGADCTLLTLDLGLTEQRLAGLGRVTVVALPCINRRFYLPAVSSRRLIEQLVGEADIVHIMGHWSVLNAWVYSSVRRAGKPYVVCPAGALPIFGRSKFLKRGYNRLIGAELIRNANRSIAVTEEEKSDFEAYGVNPHKIIVIPNGIDPEGYTTQDDACIRRKLGVGGHPYILFMGRLNLIKGIDLLVQAFCSIKDEISPYHLVVAGPDEGLRENLENLVLEHRLTDRVHFIGYISGIEKSCALHAANLLVIPSRQEAMSIVVLEGGVTGTPVLATDRCGLGELEHHGGFLVSATPEAIANSLCNILKTPEAELKQRGETLRQYICDNYLWENIALKYLEHYNHILSGI